MFAGCFRGLLIQYQFPRHPLTLTGPPCLHSHRHLVQFVVAKICFRRGSFWSSLTSLGDHDACFGHSMPLLPRATCPGLLQLVGAIASSVSAPHCNRYTYFVAVPKPDSAMRLYPFHCMRSTPCKCSRCVSRSVFSRSTHLIGTVRFDAGIHSFSHHPSLRDALSPVTPSRASPLASPRAVIPSPPRSALLHRHSRCAEHTANRHHAATALG